MTKDEALKLAHEALKKFHYAMIDAGVLDRQEVLNEGFTAATAIKEALAQPEQEPVGWMCSDFNLMHRGYSRFSPTRQGEWSIPLYTAPPQRTWVGLTDEDIKAVNAQVSQIPPIDYTTTTYAKAIEAKLKEKNTRQDGDCKHCVNGCPACDARRQSNVLP